MLIFLHCRGEVEQVNRGLPHASVVLQATHPWSKSFWNKKFEIMELMTKSYIHISDKLHRKPTYFEVFSSQLCLSVSSVLQSSNAAQKNSLHSWSFFLIRFKYMRFNMPSKNFGPTLPIPWPLQKKKKKKSSATLTQRDSLEATENIDLVHTKGMEPLTKIERKTFATEVGVVDDLQGYQVLVVTNGKYSTWLRVEWVVLMCCKLSAITKKVHDSKCTTVKWHPQNSHHSRWELLTFKALSTDGLPGILANSFWTSFHNPVLSSSSSCSISRAKNANHGPSGQETAGSRGDPTTAPDETQLMMEDKVPPCREPCPVCN